MQAQFSALFILPKRPDRDRMTGDRMVEKRFALSGASSVSDLTKSETDEDPERAKRFSTIFSVVGLCLDVLK